MDMQSGGANEDRSPDEGALASRIRITIVRYSEETGKTFRQLAQETGLSIEQIACLRGVRMRSNGKPEKPGSALLLKAHEALQKIDAYKYISMYSLTERSLYGFRTVADGYQEEPARRRYSGDWVGIAGSTFHRGLFVVFRLRMEISDTGFSIKYEQRDQGSAAMSPYLGSAYILLDNIWIFAEEEEKRREFICASLQTSPLLQPRWLLGILMGRGGSVGSAYPSASKAGIFRAGSSGQVEKLIEEGWVEVDKLRSLDREPNATEVVRHVTDVANLTGGDTALR